MSKTFLQKKLSWLLLLAAVLALMVVMLGAYTRLTNAGLGCPDWPGCYGQLVLPSTHQGLNSAQQTFPHIPIESSKAWTEMTHRYAAGTLGLLIFGCCISILWRSQASSRLALILIALVIFQACLGMWTVTLKLLPIVVMTHLLGGILVFSCLCLLYLQQQIPIIATQPNWRFLVIIGALLVFFQIALGGWVSANYAGIACIGFPTCNGQWLPHLHLSEGFNLFSVVGKNYQGGLLDNEIRTSIQIVHRLGALIVSVYLIFLSIFLKLNSTNKRLKKTAFFAVFLILIQLSLGIANVVYLLPLPVAVAHNGVAALLMATLLSMTYFARRND